LRALMPTQLASATDGALAVFTQFPRQWRSRLQSALDLRRHATDLPKASSLITTGNLEHADKVPAFTGTPILPGAWTVITERHSFMTTG